MRVDKETANAVDAFRLAVSEVHWVAEPKLTCMGSTHRRLGCMVRHWMSLLWPKK